MPPSEKVIQLRQLLSERFPGVRFTADAAEKLHSVWPTGIPQIDGLLQGGLPKSGIIELVNERKTSGSALLISALLRKAAGENQIITLIDGQDSFDPAGFEKETLSRLLWVRCRNAGEAMKAVDLILRDRNLPLVLLDLALNPAKELRKIPASTWYRLQRITEMTSTIFVVVTPQAMIDCAQGRLNLNGQFSLEDLAMEDQWLLAKLKPELAQHRLHFQPDSKEEIA